jgi:predicted transcriptional regulator
MNEMKTVLLHFMVLAVIVNVGTVGIFFYLDEIGVMEWEMLYVVPIGIANGIIIFIIHIKMEKVRLAQKDREKLR